MKYQCVRCGKIKETKQEMLTCSGSCRVAYHRYLKAGNPPLEPIRIDDDVTPVTPTLQSPPAHEQAVIDGFVTFRAGDSHEYITIPVSLYNWLMTKAEQNTEKKSDFSGATNPTFTPATEKPVVKEADPEEAKRRTIAATLASIDDF